LKYLADYLRYVYHKIVSHETVVKRKKIRMKKERHIKKEKNFYIHRKRTFDAKIR